MPAAEAKPKFARSRYARLYVMNTIGMIVHQRRIASDEVMFVSCRVAVPCKMVGLRQRLRPLLMSPCGAGRAAVNAFQCILLGARRQAFGVADHLDRQCPD